MKVEIWSDVMCPFCYIGKRRFEAALNNSEHKENVNVVWKSFQLNPNLKTDPSKNIHQYLSEIKGIPLEQAKALNGRVTQMAAATGLVYNFDNAVVANSFDAHRFSHLAKKHDVQNEAEESLFAAYFTHGKNTADHETLVQLGKEIGLDPEEVLEVLKSEAFTEDVKRDITEARQIGVQGVPFFVFNRKYAVTGAQEIRVFEEVLEKVFQEK